MGFAMSAEMYPAEIASGLQSRRQFYTDYERDLRRSLYRNEQQANGTDTVFPWPTAEIAVMGTEGTVEIMFQKEMKNQPEVLNRIIEDYKSQFLNPYLAAKRGYIGEVIDPKDTRRRIAGRSTV